MAMSDPELLDLLLHDPEEGCRVLLTQYTGFVLAIVRKRIGGVCSPQEMEELVSDILFDLYCRRQRIQLEKGSIKGLLATMTMHRCTDWYRQYTSQQAKAVQVDEILLPEAADPAYDPEEQYLHKEQCELLFAAIKQLSETDRNLIMWKYYFGETASEIAERLSMRVGAVEMRISRAKIKLRKLLGGDINVV